MICGALGDSGLFVQYGSFPLIVQRKKLVWWFYLRQGSQGSLELEFNALCPSKTEVFKCELWEIIIVHGQL